MVVVVRGNEIHCRPEFHPSFSFSGIHGECFSIFPEPCEKFAVHFARRCAVRTGLFRSGKFEGNIQYFSPIMKHVDIHGMKIDKVQLR